MRRRPELELKMLREDLYDLEQKRLKFQNVFKDHPDGPEVLAIIRNQCGANNYDADKVIPELIVFDHWLQYMIGIKHDQNFMEETQALLSAVNDTDIVNMRKQINKETNDESSTNWKFDEDSPFRS